MRDFFKNPSISASLVVLLVLLVGGYFLFFHTSPEERCLEEGGATYKVELIDDEEGEKHQTCLDEDGKPHGTFYAVGVKSPITGKLNGPVIRETGMYSHGTKVGWWERWDGEAKKEGSTKWVYIKTWHGGDEPEVKKLPPKS